MGPLEERLLREALEHIQAGRLEAAASCYRRILQNQPDCVHVVTGLADVLEALGRVPEAVALLEQSSTASPGSAPCAAGWRMVCMLRVTFIAQSRSISRRSCSIPPWLEHGGALVAR